MQAEPVDGYVAVAGARRRLRALGCLGWSVAELANRIRTRPDLTPVAVSTLDAIRSGRTDSGIRPQFDRSIRAIYDELSMMVAPQGRSASRARAHALQCKWLPPLAYDDETLDDIDPLVEQWARKAVH